jgi:hypothetical protein
MGVKTPSGIVPDVKLLLGLILMSLCVTGAFAQGAVTSTILKGVDYLDVGRCTIDDEKYLLTESEVQEIIELKCRTNGIKVLNRNAFDTTEEYMQALLTKFKGLKSAAIRFDILQVSTPDGRCAYTMKLFVNEIARLERNKDMVVARVFEEEVVGLANTENMKQKMREFVEKKMDKLCLELLRANEK